MKLVLRLMGFAGVIIFGFPLVLTYLSPIHVERAARGVIQYQMERRLADELGIVGGMARETRLRSFAAALSAQHQREIGALRGRLATGLNVRIASVVANMQNLGCECRDRMLQGLNAATELRIATLERAEPQLRRLIEGKYGEIVADLLRDLRIFAGANMLAFFVLLVLSVAKPDRIRQLFVPAILLGAAAVTSSAVYVFGQNWFFTLLYGDYVGLTYGAWLLIIFGLFCDIALFRARITTRIADTVFSALGSAPIPC